MKLNGHSALILLSLGIAPIMATPVAAQKHNAPGVTDTEIKVGQTMPYSGPASAWGAVGRAEVAYLKMINDRGGIRGRKVTLISRDDGFSPPKTVEQTRTLIEGDQVAFIFNSLAREMGLFANTSTSIAYRSSSFRRPWRNSTTRNTIPGP